MYDNNETLYCILSSGQFYNRQYVYWSLAPLYTGFITNSVHSSPPFPPPPGVNTVFVNAVELGLTMAEKD
jgi:hypothetical protein